MPICRSFLRFPLMWELRAAAMRCCQWSRRLAMSLMSKADARLRSHQLGINAPTAACTWLIVGSDLFSRNLIRTLAKKITHRCQDQVPLQAQPAAAFPLVQADLLFLILETAFHMPSRKRRQQDVLHAGFRRRVAHEILDLRRVQDIAYHDQCIPMPGNPRSSFVVIRTCLISQTIVPFSPSLMRYRTHA
jgi:hypothetical protein